MWEEVKASLLHACQCLTLSIKACTQRTRKQNQTIRNFQDEKRSWYLLPDTATTWTYLNTLTSRHYASPFFLKQEREKGLPCPPSARLRGWLKRRQLCGTQPCLSYTLSVSRAPQAQSSLPQPQLSALEPNKVLCTHPGTATSLVGDVKPTSAISDSSVHVLSLFPSCTTTNTIQLTRFPAREPVPDQPEWFYSLQIKPGVKEKYFAFKASEFSLLISR